ncbi:MAG: discoidin domain-containing protein [Verrucomicrobiales bacterium]|nr:discoidin domain-containing protein [Verrucomicrobiales bacterium]MCP5527158.1 discoidin domain-containing protein [Verrucomicrobiales bacterium]
MHRHLVRPASLVGLLAAACLSQPFRAFTAPSALEAGWEDPPVEARLRAYWWWLNGNVTRASITRDLEAMRAQGFGGALICDADGSEQRGNERAPHGPTFFSPEWRALYRHALAEADRLGLEMSLNIQSGWNLGGPMVTPDDAPKKLVWTRLTVDSPTVTPLKVEPPRGRDGYYRDLFVLAYPLQTGGPAEANPATIRSSSAQPDHPAESVADGRPETFWVSAGAEPGGGPTPERPQWIEYSFPTPLAVDRLILSPRPDYGPKDAELRVRLGDGEWKSTATFTVERAATVTVRFPVVRAKVFRVLFRSAHDPRFPDAPRNVQVAGLTLAGPAGEWPVPPRRGLLNWEQKAMHRALHFSAPDTTPLLEEWPSRPDEADVRAADVVDLSGRLRADGTLDWTPPAGRWEVLRLGCTLNDHCRVSTCSEGWDGYALDPFDAGAFQRYWEAVVEPLIADAGPLAGRVLKYLHTDSWEVEVANWTPTLREEFRRRRGYDLAPFLPVIAGRLVGSREVSNRFLHDLRRTLGDLAIDHHYRLFKENAHRHGLLIHPESGGPHAVPIDAQECLGFNDAPMSEFWAWSWEHRVGDANRFFVKQPASAAHTYGHRLVLAEGFTTIGPHWQETLWDNLKPAFDKACGEGLNLLVWHAFVCSPQAMGLPGQQYFAGTHLNPNVTWWSRSKPFFDYVNRCQWMLQQGRFVADVAYYYGNHVPNFSQLKRSDPAGILPGYDYDVVTAGVICDRMTVVDGRLTLPDGMAYRALVLPDQKAISRPVLRKLQTLVADGATVIGPRPERAASLQDHPARDAEVRRLADELWAAASPETGPTAGRIIAGHPVREVLQARGVRPDFEFRSTSTPPSDTPLDYLHRRVDDVDLYFVACRTNRSEDFVGVFRATGRTPELWNPVTGERRPARAFTQRDGRTEMPLHFDPCGSWFVVFRSPSAGPASVGTDNRDRFESMATLEGAWTVHFDPDWGGPATVGFPQLVDWTTRPEPGIRFYSGTARYERSFDWPAGGAVASGHPSAEVWLDLGELRELAEVRLNGRELGILWTPPFRVRLDDALRPGPNRLEIDIVNFWPNRIIGDASLPVEQRRTRTNIRKLTAESPLMPSGLLGPVRLLRRIE